MRAASSAPVIGSAARSRRSEAIMAPSVGGDGDAQFGALDRVVLHRAGLDRGIGEAKAELPPSRELRPAWQVT